MTVCVPLRFEREFEVPARPDVVHALLADVPRSASHFPEVERVVPLGDNSFRWEMHRHGIRGFSVQTIYASQYESDARALRTSWRPIPEVGNARVSGHWQLRPHGTGTRVHFEFAADLDVSVPHFMERPLEGLVHFELTHLVDHYLTNLQATIRGLADADAEARGL
jgi:carbon monoxide dehydrogenase subunit G